MSQQNVEIVRRLYAAFARRDNESPFELYDPEIEWDMSRSAYPGDDAVYRGHDGVRRYWRGWLEAWESVEAPVERLVDAGDHVVALLGATIARGKGSGVETTRPPWAQVWTLRDGKVTRMRIYNDHADALAAVGLVE